METIMDENDDRMKKWWMETIVKIEMIMDGNNGG